MLSIAEISSLLKEREVSPVEVVDAVLERINELQPRLNSYIAVLQKEAREEAIKTEVELKKEQKSPLHGVPLSLKDLFYTKGVHTTSGSKLFSNFIPTYDGTVTSRLREAGAIIIGKTNMHELAIGATNEDSFFGPTRNPWDPSKITGGSSGGSAATVATGMSYMSVGSDTGGSSRIPAALCGVFGFKPSFGLVSRYGMLLLSFTLDHVGLFTRSIMDIALTLDVIAGYDNKDTSTSGYEGKSLCFTDSIKETVNLSGIKIGLPKNYFFDKTDYEVERLVREAVKDLQNLGAEIVEIQTPNLGMFSEISATIMFTEAAHIHKELFLKASNEFRPNVRERLKKGISTSAMDYLDALKEKDRIKVEWENALKNLDVIAMPTVPIVAYPIGTSKVVTRAKEEVVTEMYPRHTRLANMTQGPALSLPCGFTTEGLPAGLMLMGSKFDDSTVLKVGYAYEKKNPLRFPV